LLQDSLLLYNRNGVLVRRDFCQHTCFPQKILMGCT
jgi:hypothetical protein